MTRGAASNQEDRLEFSFVHPHRCLHVASLTVEQTTSIPSLIHPSTTMVANKKKKSSEQPLVPETVLRKRHDLDELARQRAANAEPQKNHKSKSYIRKPETILAQSKTRRNHLTRYKRVLKKGMQKRASTKPERATKSLDDGAALSFQSNSVGAQLVFAVRIRDHGGAPAPVKQILRKLRLKELHEGVFVPYTAEKAQQLQLVEPWVVYGPPSKALVQDLILRRGFGRVQNQRVALSDNTVIETALGEDGILCVEDLVHELYSVGDLFGKVNAFLWPFRLADSKNYFERRTLKLKDGKDYGDRGEAINDYLQTTL